MYALYSPIPYYLVTLIFIASENFRNETVPYMLNLSKVITS